MSSPRWQFGVLSWFVLGAFAVLGVMLTMDFGSDDPFMPHAHCYLFNRQLMWLHGGSDFLIGAAYVAISATLIYLVVRAREEIPFHWIMLAFAIFIVACGATHFMEVWTLQTPNPRYWLSGNVKLVTAIASVGTALLLPPLIPKVLALLHAARLSAERKMQLESAYAELGNLYEKVKQLDELKTNFFANASHELRTPLALVFGPVDRLLGSPNLPEDQRRDLGMVRRNALLLQKHVNDLLDIARLDAGKMSMRWTSADLARIARMVRAMFESPAEERLINLTFDVPETLPAEVDADKVQRILINLVSNALKFCPEGGEVRVSLQEVEGAAVLIVDDSGPGVAPELRTSVFERFQQGDPAIQQRFEGTGLGLAIVKEFAELHHGSVQLDDSPAGGARFTVRLPLRAPEGSAIAVASLPSAPAPSDQAAVLFERGSMRPQPVAPAGTSAVPRATDGGSGDTEAQNKPLVLVIEDNREMSEFITRVLEPEFSIITAFDGDEGMRLAEQHEPDLILRDVMMPGMPGEQFLEWLRTTPKLAPIPLIVLTAKADDDLKTRLLATGAQDYLIKPFAVEELRARARNQITAKLTRDTLQRELATQNDDIAQLAREVTVRARQLELAKEEAEAANRAKDQFIAVLSHELRTPLTPALAITAELESGEEMDKAQLREAIGVIRRNIELEARLIDDLLDVTRISRGKFELQLRTVDAHSEIRNAVEMCRAELMEQGADRDLETHLKAERHHVKADSPRLLQVFWNLILNSIKFTPSGGRIDVRTWNADDKLHVEVSDTGVGIEPQALSRIFDPFEQGEPGTTRRFGGLGLGLTVAKALVDAHGGTITAQSEGRNRGTVMRIELPTVPAERLVVLSAPSEPTRPAEREGQAAPRVLLVEDHQDTRSAMMKLLGRWGYVVIAAATIQEALSKAATESFDIIVSDLGLPDGHGTELMIELRKRGPVRGIAMSGFGMDEDIARSEQAGFAEHLIKPVAAQKLRETIEAVLADRKT